MRVSKLLLSLLRKGLSPLPGNANEVAARNDVAFEAHVSEQDFQGEGRNVPGLQLVHLVLFIGIQGFGFDQDL